MRVHPAFLYPAHPLASVTGPFNAVTIESPAITEITLSGPGAGGPQTASAILGDVVSAIPATLARRRQRGRGDDRRRRRVGVLPAPGGRRPSRRARAGRRAPRPAGRLRALGRPGGPGGHRAPGDRHAPRRRVALLRGARAHLRAGLHARRAAGDPRDRRDLRRLGRPPGLIERYRDRLPFAPDDPVVSLQEGSTPLVYAREISERVGARCGSRSRAPTRPARSRTAA